MEVGDAMGRAMVAMLNPEAVRTGGGNPNLRRARQSAEIAGYTISKVQRWLHEVALKKIEPDTGLYHPDGNFNYQDAWADCYPFLVWAAWLTDVDALNGPVRGALHTVGKIKGCRWRKNLRVILHARLQLVFIFDRKPRGDRPSCPARFSLPRTVSNSKYL